MKRGFNPCNSPGTKLHEETIYEWIRDAADVLRYPETCLCSCPITEEEACQTGFMWHIYEDITAWQIQFLFISSSSAIVLKRENVKDREERRKGRRDERVIGACTKVVCLFTVHLSPSQSWSRFIQMKLSQESRHLPDCQSTDETGALVSPADIKGIEFLHSSTSSTNEPPNQARISSSHDHRQWQHNGKGAELWLHIWRFSVGTQGCRCAEADPACHRGGGFDGAPIDYEHRRGRLAERSELKHWRGMAANPGAAMRQGWLPADNLLSIIIWTITEAIRRGRERHDFTHTEWKSL